MENRQGLGESTSYWRRFGCHKNERGLWEIGHRSYLRGLKPPRLTPHGPPFPIQILDTTCSAENPEHVRTQGLIASTRYFIARLWLRGCYRAKYDYSLRN